MVVVEEVEVVGRAVGQCSGDQDVWSIGLPTLVRQEPTQLSQRGWGTVHFNEIIVDFLSIIVLLNNSVHFLEVPLDSCD